MSKQIVVGGKTLEVEDDVVMPAEYQEALEAYASANGPGWMKGLAADWATGQDVHFQNHGAELRGIRNHPYWAYFIYEGANGCPSEDGYIRPRMRA